MAENLETQNSRKKRVLSAVSTIALFLAVFGTVFYIHQNYSIISVSGSSMSDTLKDGDTVIIQKKSSLVRGDIIVFSRPDSFPQKSDNAPKMPNNMIKRIVGVPGDRLEINSRNVYINGENVMSANTDFLYRLGVDKETVHIDTVLTGFFAVGDNYRDSVDSLRVAYTKGEGFEVPKNLVVTGGKIVGKIPSLIGD